MSDLRFKCHFTKDLMRKNKRFQDGVLTFSKCPSFKGLLESAEGEKLERFFPKKSFVPQIGEIFESDRHLIEITDKIGNDENTKIETENISKNVDEKATKSGEEKSELIDKHKSSKFSIYENKKKNKIFKSEETTKETKKLKTNQQESFKKTQDANIWQKINHKTGFRSAREILETLEKAK
ncbi:hypothetical protein MHBO_002970 [Bonamia ostreae]|uniref:5'-3' DNA helicase ZGRF1-like N-terminal domain-containing protein n=1 Tax=Bonamia ostreae TaxID=126728 RepID=A0ABV2AP37_9EUKA